MPEHNQKFHYSEFFENEIVIQKNRAGKIFKYKKNSLFENKFKERKVNPTNGFAISKTNIHFFEKKINVVTTKEDVFLAKIDLSKQYVKQNISQPIPYTKEDLEKKFGIIPETLPDQDVLNEIRAMQKRGL